MGEIIMPTELTAENGAKYAFIGEFNIRVEHVCCDCLGEVDDCEICGGEGVYYQDYAVPWTTIKKIYKKAVELLGKPI